MCPLGRQKPPSPRQPANRAAELFARPLRRGRQRPKKAGEQGTSPLYPLAGSPGPRHASVGFLRPEGRPPFLLKWKISMGYIRNRRKQAIKFVHCSQHHPPQHENKLYSSTPTLSHERLLHRLEANMAASLFLIYRTRSRNNGQKASDNPQKNVAIGPTVNGMNVAGRYHPDNVNLIFHLWLLYVGCRVKKKRC